MLNGDVNSFRGQRPETAMTWTDNASNESGFIVEWSTTTSFDDPAGTDYAPPNSSGNPVNFTASGPFDPATSYYFRVSAYNDYGP